ncbi:MAG: hypothetical protein M1311_01320, partial [Thaumarchaeota archaeon]|nr:hypothetical protein [Nitrososphaerota archaeon]
GVDGVDEETLEGWREGIAGKEDGKGAGAREKGEEGEKAVDAKDGASEVRKDPKKAGPDAGEAPPQEEKAGKDAPKEHAQQDKGGSNGADDADRMKEGREEVKDVRSKAGTKDPRVDEKPPDPEPPEKPGPGSYTRNDDQILVVEHASPGQKKEEQAETPGLRRLQGQNEREEVPRVLEAVDYGKGANVRVPMCDLEQAGYGPPDHSAIVQLELRPIEGDEVEAVYARYNASSRRAEAYVGDIGGAKGSKYELVEAKGVDEYKMARDFERGKCEHLQNVRLEREEGKMFLNVDGRQVELEGYKMSTSGSHLVLRGKLEGKDDCKLEFDGHRAAVRFGRDYPVEGMRMEGDELVVKYVQSKNEVHEHRQSLDHPDIGDRKLSLGQLDKPEALRLARLLDAPEGTDGVYTFAVDRRLQESVKSILEGAVEEGTRRYGVVKGEVGEGLISNLMNLAGWERIERHPFNETRKVGVTGNGTDHVFRDPDHKLSISESKYWGQIESALKRGEIQVGTYYDRQRKYQGEEIERGYVMVMDWNLNDDPIRIHVRRVRQVVNSNV